jgi:hypothetical protein
MTEITRFDMDMYGSMEPSEHGEWVRYWDAQRTWVGLTKEEVFEICNSHYNRDSELVEMVEAKLKERNT